MAIDRANKTKAVTERNLTVKQELFCQYMFTIGSESYSNGTHSAKRAGYKGNDVLLGVVASQNIRKLCIINRKAEIQARTVEKVDHDRDRAISMLKLDYDNLATAATEGNVSAILARTAIVRELNAISSLHSSTLNTGDVDRKELSERQKHEAKRIASIRLHREMA